METLAVMVLRIVWRFRRGALAAIACMASLAYLLGTEGAIFGFLFGVGAGLFIEGRLRLGTWVPGALTSQSAVHWLVVGGASVFLTLSLIWVALVLT